MTKARRKTKKRRARAKERDALSLKQARFVTALVGEAKGNAALAARLAGYVSKSAQGFARIGEENRRKPEISKAIEARVRELEAAGMATSVEVHTFLTSAMRAAGKHLADPETVTAQTVEQFGSLMHVGMSAAAQLVKVHGLAAPKKIDVSGTVEAHVTLDDEVQRQLEIWLLVKDDPRVRAVIEEITGP